MDVNKHTNRQHKTTDISPYLRKAQVISPEVCPTKTMKDEAKINSQRAQNSQNDSDNSVYCEQKGH